MSTTRGIEARISGTRIARGRTPRHARLAAATALFVATLVLRTAPARAQAGSAPITTYSIGNATSITDLIQTIVVRFTGRPFNTDAEIDRLVGNGDPWNLLPQTSVKLVTIQPRLRFQIFGLLAERYSQILLTPIDGSLSSQYDLNVRPWILQLDMNTSSQVLTPVLDTILTHFTDVETIDLVTATVFSLPFGPRRQSSWRHLKHWIDTYDIPLILAIAMVGALANAGTLQIGGQLTSFRRQTAGVGWYLGTQNLGINLNAVVRGGLTLLTNTTEVFAGLVGQFNAPLHNSENLGVETLAKQHWVSRFGRPVGWEFVIDERAQAVISHNDQTASRFIGQLDGYARRPVIFGDPNLNFLTSFSALSDFLGNAQVTAAVGLDEDRHDTTLVFQVTALRDLHTGIDTYRAGFFGGGSLDSRFAHVSYELFRQARRLRGLLASVRAARDRYDSNGGDQVDERVQTALERNEHDRSQRLWHAQRDELARVYSLYVAARREYFDFREQDDGVLTDDDGVLEPDVFVAVRGELDK